MHEVQVEDQEFVDRIREKIERMSGRQVELRIDQDDSSQIGVELSGDMPVVILGKMFWSIPVSLAWASNMQ